MAKRKSVDWSDLRSLYEVHGMGCKAIAKLKKCSPVSVWEALKKRGIQTRTQEESVTRGPSHRNYRHGISPTGYQRARTGSGQRVLGHRSTAAAVLGRPLGRWEIVHHCNEIKTDNRPENLWVFPSHSAHIKFHKTGTIHSDTIFLKDHTT